LLFSSSYPVYLGKDLAIGEIKQTITSAMHIPFVNAGDEYYLGIVYTCQNHRLRYLQRTMSLVDTIPLPAPALVPEDGFGCSFPAGVKGSLIYGGAIPVLGILLVIGISSYLRRRRRP